MWPCNELPPILAYPIWKTGHREPLAKSTPGGMKLLSLSHTLIWDLRQSTLLRGKQTNEGLCHANTFSTQETPFQRPEAFQRKWSPSESRSHGCQNLRLNLPRFKQGNENASVAVRFAGALVAGRDIAGLRPRLALVVVVVVSGGGSCGKQRAPERWLNNKPWLQTFAPASLWPPRCCCRCGICCMAMPKVTGRAVITVILGTSQTLAVNVRKGFFFFLGQTCYLLQQLKCHLSLTNGPFRQPQFPVIAIMHTHTHATP